METAAVASVGGSHDGGGSFWASEVAACTAGSFWATEAAGHTVATARPPASAPVVGAAAVGGEATMFDATFGVTDSDMRTAPLAQTAAPLTPAQPLLFQPSAALFESVDTHDAPWEPFMPNTDAPWEPFREGAVNADMLSSNPSPAVPAAVGSAWAGLEAVRPPGTAALGTNPLLLAAPALPAVGSTAKSDLDSLFGNHPLPDPMTIASPHSPIASPGTPTLAAPTPPPQAPVHLLPPGGNGAGSFWDSYGN